MTASARRQATTSRRDVAGAAHLQGVFGPTTTEIDVLDLRVDGELPASIDGDYLRNGPNPRFPPLGRYRYPLDGDAMLHRVRIRGGRACYSNRFVRTPALICEEAAGQELWPGRTTGGKTPGAYAVGPVLAHTRKDSPHFSIVRHAGRLLALADSANPFLISAELDTAGQETFCGMLAAGITAHPKIDPVTGDMVVFRRGLSEPYLTWSVVGPDGVPVRAETPVEGVTRPSVVIDMALTASYLVLVLAPLFNGPAHAPSASSPLLWEPEHGTRIALIPRDGAPVQWLSTEALWLWHVANAYDTSTANGQPSVTLDYVRRRNPGCGTAGRHGSLFRMRLDPNSGSVTHEQLAPNDVEFPRIDDRAVTTAHRVIAACVATGRHELLAGDADALGWYDTDVGRFDLWLSDDDLALGEQTYIPEPGDPDPRSGWWTTIATDRNDLTSQLLIISAENPAAGPVAAVHLPQRVPHGLHGTWLPAEPQRPR